MDIWHGLQWAAMAATLLAAWLVASQRQRRRTLGFWVYMLSNVLWTAWGFHDEAWALVTLQFGLALMNTRGVWKNRADQDGGPKPARSR